MNLTPEEITKRTHTTTSYATKKLASLHNNNLPPRYNVTTRTITFPTTSGFKGGLGGRELRQDVIAHATDGVNHVICDSNWNHYILNENNKKDKPYIEALKKQPKTVEQYKQNK